MGTHKIWADEGIIRIALIGMHTQEDAGNIIKDVEEFLPENRKGLVLTDMSRIEKPTSRARKVHADNIKNNHDKYEKLAFYGASVMNRVMANFIIKASGHNDKVRYFDTELEAINWLKE
jgi:dsRNA-specific ribonuclease